MKPLLFVLNAAPDLAASLGRCLDLEMGRIEQRRFPDGEAYVRLLDSPRGRILRAGGTPPERDAQFQHINRWVKAFQRQGQPVVSVDTKKKELVGPYRNGGREWQPRGEPEEVKVHDFIDPALWHARQPAGSIT